MIETATQQGILGCSVFLVFNIDAIKESLLTCWVPTPQKKLENFEFLEVGPKPRAKTNGVSRNLKTSPNEEKKSHLPNQTFIFEV